MRFIQGRWNSRIIALAEIRCEECRAIARELVDAWASIFEKAAGQGGKSAALGKATADWRAWMRDGELNAQDRPIVAPEILDLNRWSEAPPAIHPLARVFYKKIRHESRTGHKIKFPPEI